MAQWDGVENVYTLVCDVTNADDIERMVGEAETRFGRLDCDLNIAGINDLSYPLDETDDERWDKVMNIDVKAPFRICRRAISTMVKNGDGSIVNIGSYAALRGNHGPSYTAAKAGLAGLTKSIAFGFADKGVRCNIIHPGGMATNITKTSGGAYHEAAQAKLSKLIMAMPVTFYGQPEEVANACLFLCSDESKLINGIELSVDGGMAVC